MSQPEYPLPTRCNRLVFSVPDRDGNEVRLTTGQWRGHILRKHSEVEPFLEQIKAVIENPQLVAAGRNDEVYLLALGAITSRPQQFLKVVVAYSDEVTGRRIGSVRTAYLTARHPRGVIYERESD